MTNSIEIPVLIVLSEHVCQVSVEIFLVPKSNYRNTQVTSGHGPWLCSTSPKLIEIQKKIDEMF